ncbi:MAG: hypothetical protein JWM46_392 [Candidatus Kaiserbacteria bacterium]|nr:hypothetical protein [Candidatus Kaiserbacteria bacterium]
MILGMAIKPYRNVLIGLTLLCLILLAASAYLFFNDALAMRRAGFLSGPRGWHQARTPETAPTATGIRAWMTFDFINDIFDLPPDYLKNTLSIRAAAYPKLTVAQAAKLEGIPQDEFLLKVQAATASYSALTP